MFHFHFYQVINIVRKNKKQRIIQNDNLLNDENIKFWLFNVFLQNIEIKKLYKKMHIKNMVDHDFLEYEGKLNLVWIYSVYACILQKYSGNFSGLFELDHLG